VGISEISVTVTLMTHPQSEEKLVVLTHVTVTYVSDLIIMGKDKY